MSIFRRDTDSERGMALVEYALLVAVIALGASSAVMMVGHETEETFTTVAEAIDEGPSTSQSGPVSSAMVDNSSTEQGSGNLNSGQDAIENEDDSPTTDPEDSGGVFVDSNAMTSFSGADDNTESNDASETSDDTVEDSSDSSEPEVTEEVDESDEAEADDDEAEADQAEVDESDEIEETDEAEDDEADDSEVEDDDRDDRNSRNDRNNRNNRNNRTYR